MSGPVVTCAGSSRGAQLPPSPIRLPSHCESDILQPNYKYVKFIESVLDNQ